MKLTVYGRASSSNVQALLWGMEELGLPYDRLNYGETFGGLDSAEFRALNPHGKIPVLRIDDTALFETGAILRYLANRFGSESFWPADPLRRAEIDMWADWAKLSVALNFTGPVFWRAVRTRPDCREPERIQRALARFEAELSVAEPRLESHAYLCGHDLTLADIQFGHVLYRYFDMDIERRVLPALKAYYARLCERPAYRKTVMVSYEDLRDTF